MQMIKVVTILLLLVALGALYQYSSMLGTGHSTSQPEWIEPTETSTGVVGAPHVAPDAPAWYISSRQHFDTANEGAPPFCSLIEPAVRDGPRNTPSVHVVVVNRGNVMLLANLLCSMKKININQIVFLAMDELTCPHLERLGLVSQTQICIPYLERLVKQMRLAEPESVKQLDEERKTVDISNASDWGSVIHKLIITAKLYALRDILECGYGAFVTDVDVAFFSDPLPAFTKIFANHSSNLTMVYQHEMNPGSILNLNTGFFYLLPVPENLVFAHAILELAIWWQIDQARVNIFVKSGNFTNVGGWIRLPHLQFPNGRYIHIMLSDGLKFPLSPPATATHANWSGSLRQKLDMMSKTGCWFLNVNQTGIDDMCYEGDVPAPPIPDVDWVIQHLNKRKKSDDTL